MATTTATRKRSKQAKNVPLRGPNAWKNAMDMTRGRGDNKYTYYQPGVARPAKQRGVPIKVIGKDGKIVLSRARLVDRDNLTAVYNDTHEQAGKGKYIDMGAIDQQLGQTVVIGAQHVNPYLIDDGSYHTLIEAFKKLVGNKTLSGLKAVLKTNRTLGHHLDWRGKRDETGAVAVSPWTTKEELWTLAQTMNPALRNLLAKSKCQREDVKAHLNARAKFFQNLNVLRRAREVVHVATGEHEFGGGATPYAMPLEQCGMSIDMAWLTTGVDDDGNETGGYFYRLAIGRSTPNVLYYRDWEGLDTGAKYAYIDEPTRKLCIAARKKSVAYSRYC